MEPLKKIIPQFTFGSKGLKYMIPFYTGVVDFELAS